MYFCRIWGKGRGGGEDEDEGKEDKKEEEDKEQVIGYRIYNTEGDGVDRPLTVGTFMGEGIVY